MGLFENLLIYDSGIIKIAKMGCGHNLGLKYILEGQLIMYKLKEIKHALKILKQYDFQFSKASKATGIKFVLLDVGIANKKNANHF